MRVRGHRRRSRPEDGASAVEFALVVPLVLVLLMGVVQFSLYFFSGQSGQNAAREAARRAAVGDQSCAALTSVTRSNAKLVADGFSVTRSYHDPASGATRPAGAIQVGDDVRVVVRYRTIDLNFPLIPVPSTGGVRAQITESAVARLESVTSVTGACS